MDGLRPGLRFAGAGRDRQGAFRTTFVVYPTAEEAAAGSREASKYFTPLTEWEKTTTEAGTEFSTKFTVPFAWVNRQVLLHVEWASSAYEIRLNGKVADIARTGAIRRITTSPNRSGKGPII